MITTDRSQVVAASSLENLSLDSKLQDLSLHTILIDVQQTGIEVARIFDTNPLLPGAILMEENALVGMISRRRFLEQMSRPYGIDLFSRRPIKMMYQFAGTEYLICSGDRLIVDAAQQALQRSSDVLYEPVIVQLETGEYRLLDVHELLIAQAKIHELTTRLLHEQTQAKFIQTEKMASLGQMVAGVAHEILNPVNFIWGNVDYLSQYADDLISLVTTYDQETPQESEIITNLKQDIEYEFLLKDLPQVISSMKLGTERLRKIINALRNFSHMDEAKPRPTDLHECIDNTLLILQNRLKLGVDVVRQYGKLPPVNCFSGQLSQVFMNLISNAIDALTDEAHAEVMRGRRPCITIMTDTIAGSENQRVLIRITDNGSGIPPDIQTRVFEMFFTTKPVGKGTGLGLAISNQIVTEKHKGQLNLSSEAGVGTTFEIVLPVEGP